MGKSLNVFSLADRWVLIGCPHAMQVQRISHNRMERTMTAAPEIQESAFSFHASRWWGSRLVILVEVIALTSLAVAYFYIRSRSGSWPQSGTTLPDLRVPSLGLLVICLGAAPFWNASRLARRHARPRLIAGWLALGVLFGVSAIVLRGYDFAALHTRFNSNEYGAITWTILTVHLAHLLAATLESSLVAGMLFGAPEEKVSYDDVTAMAVYWYLIAFSWILFYVIVFISPRFRFV
jgi:cytochrome c oxidase subunit I+III